MVMSWRSHFVTNEWLLSMNSRGSVENIIDAVIHPNWEKNSNESLIIYLLLGEYIICGFTNYRKDIFNATYI